MSEQNGPPAGPVNPNDAQQAIAEDVLHLLYGQAPADQRLDRAQAELARTAGMAGGIGAGLAVDPERARVAVTRLDEALDALARAILRLRRGMTFPPPGADVVSVNLAKQAGVMASRAEAFAQAYAAQIAQARDALLAQIEAYQRTERTTAERA